MSWRRVTMVLAIMAALAGAPSSVSAAAPNQLSEASVTPPAGGPSTLFVVSVRYVSHASNPAIAVTASGGGQVAVLTLHSGTATDGVWRGTTTFPPGSWEVTVQANVVKGASPSLTAGTVSVGSTTTEPPPSSGDAPSFGPGPGTGGGGTLSSPAAQPAATPPTSSAASQAPARSSTAPAPSQPPSGPASGGTAPVGRGRSGEAPARSPVAMASGGSEGAQSSPDATPTTGVAPAPDRDDGGLGLFIVMGLLAVGTVALVGSAWVVLAAQRDRRATVAQSLGSDPGVSAAAIVEQRARRRARLRSTDDPILAAMGLPQDKVTPDPPPPSRGKKARTRGRRRRPAR